MGALRNRKRVMGAWQYDDQDLERLSLIMTLHDSGFENEEVEEYKRLLLEEKHGKAADGDAEQAPGNSP